MPANETAEQPQYPDLDGYSGYAGLPPLVSLHTMRKATTIGLSVRQSVERLKRIHWSLKRLHGIFVARVTSMPIYEIKMAFSLHAYYCAEYVDALAGRIGEMRQPPHGMDLPPNAALDLLFDEIVAAPTLQHLLVGLYKVAVPAVTRALEHLVTDTNRLLDHASFRICRLALVEWTDVQRYGDDALHCLVTEQQGDPLQLWISHLSTILRAAGDLDGREPESGESPGRRFSAKPYTYDPVPQRDERFRDPYNMGVNAEAMLLDPSIDPLPKTLMLYFKRMREIDVPEMMASILMTAENKPWKYFRDMTRQLWDEARHAMMGEIGFVSMGIDWTEIPINFTWSLGLNTTLSSKERHAVLYAIEQGLMPKRTGKEYEWEVAVSAASALASLIQDFDWADEVLHARIGREWIVPEIGSQLEAMAYGDKALSKLYLNWNKWKQEGLTEHRNWWPDLYRVACARWGITPDPKLLAYHISYESLRADLKNVTPE
ncbi:MAG TPA: hypothetical protein VLJ11_12145 [Bryobacteraceae bacterium]|nr:hypothetical protein [Bryobacteraceae bacterium]